MAARPVAAVEWRHEYNPDANMRDRTADVSSRLNASCCISIRRGAFASVAPMVV
jgi:hypothetical protein